MPDNLNYFQHWLLIANSRSHLPKSKILSWAKHKKIMVLDGAYEYVMPLDLHVDVLLGDFDSIQPHTLSEVYKKNIQVVHAPDQNQTDLDKGIAYLDQLQAKSITLCAATGERMQHTLYNLMILKKCHRTVRPIALFTQNETIHYVENSLIEINGSIGDSVGVFGFPEAVISTHGLKYEVDNYSLPFELAASTSNELIQSRAIIHVQGAVLVIHEGQES